MTTRVRPDMLLNTKTPCCGRPVRIPVTVAGVGLREAVERRCACGKRWEVLREPLVERSGLRADRLTWQPLGPPRRRS